MRTTASRLAARMDAENGAWPTRDWALFDVREVGESQRGHIWGATFLPRRTIEFRLAQLVSARQTSIVLYDSGENGDRRAARALQTMTALGYGNVELLAGGLAAWAGSGREVVSGWNVPSKLFGEEIAHSSEISLLTAGELARRLAAGERLRVLDVRTVDEYAAGSLPESVSAPSFDWTMNVDDLAQESDGLVVHCAGRTRSIIGAVTARVLGLTNVWALENGTMGWLLSERDLTARQEYRLPVATESSRAIAARRARDAAKSQGVEFLSAEGFASLLGARDREPVYAFDVRDPDARHGGHIAATTSLPGGQACQRADDFVAVSAAPIVFVDDADSRAAITAYWFRRMGFPKVLVLEGGVPGWRAAGGALERGGGQTAPLGLSAAESATPAIDTAKLKAALQHRPPPLVIDVGTSKHFASHHVESAQWVPRGSLEDRITDIADHGTPIVVTAWRPAQAAFAAAALASLGYRDVSRLALAGPQWRGLLPLQTGLPDGCGEPHDVLAIPYRKGKEQMREYLEWEKNLAGSLGRFPPSRRA